MMLDNKHGNKNNVSRSHSLLFLGGLWDAVYEEHLLALQLCRVT